MPWVLRPIDIVVAVAPPIDKVPVEIVSRVPPAIKLTSPSFCKTNLVVPEDEAVNISPPVVLLLTTNAATADSVAKTPNLSSTSTPPGEILPVAVVFARGFLTSTFPIPSGSIMTLLLVPVFVVRSKG